MGVAVDGFDGSWFEGFGDSFGILVYQELVGDAFGFQGACESGVNGSAGAVDVHKLGLVGEAGFTRRLARIGAGDQNGLDILVGSFQVILISSLHASLGQL